MTGITTCHLGVMGAGDNNPDGVQLDPSSAINTVLFPSSAFAQYALNGNGTSTITGDISPSDWIDVPANAGDYEVRATLNSGSLTGGTTGSWLPLGGARSWSNSQSGFGESTANITLEVRAIGGGPVLSSVTVNVRATVEA